MGVQVKFQFRRLAEALTARSAVAGGAGHGSTIGTMRELLVKDFLRPHIPNTLDILSGVILDSKDGRSSQQDIVLVDKRFPHISIGSPTDALIIAESVLATIEVKSNLRSGDLEEVLASVDKTKRLTRTGELRYERAGVSGTGSMTPIISYVFAFTGVSLETVLQTIKSYSEEHPGLHVPDAICILDRGVVLRSPWNIRVKPTIYGSNVTPPLFGQTTLERKELKKDALFAFHGRLLEDVQPLSVVNYHLDGYFADDKLE